VTIQFPQLDQTEPRLLTDSTAQRDRDSSFDEKLRQEQARLGLLFSPFSQLSSFFTGSLDLGSAFERSVHDLSIAKSTAGQTETDRDTTDESAPRPSVQTRQGSVQLFDSLPLASLSRQTLQELLVQTNWLVPNLQAQPFFFNASLTGELRPSLDLQALVDQIAKQVNMVRSKGRVEFALTLEPEELGQLVLTLTARGGLISVDIQSSTETKKLLEDRRAELEKALAKASVRCDRITIREVKEHV
jgi:flagellar hook-length control protein FliK